MIAEGDNGKHQILAVPMSKKLAIWLLLAWLLLALVSGYVLWAFQPQGPTKWALFLVAGPPLYLLLTGVGELLGKAYARFPGIRQGNELIDRRTAGRSLSMLRVLWYLFTGLLTIGIMLTAAWLYRTYF